MRLLRLSLLLALGLAPLLALPACDLVSTGGRDGDDLTWLRELLDCPHEGMIGIGAGGADGTLGTDSCRNHGTGPFVEYYGLRTTGPGPMNVRILLTSNFGGADGFDPYLILRDSLGAVLAENDDIDFPGGDFNARIDRNLLRGLYSIGVRSASIGETGAYHLSVNPN